MPYGGEPSANAADKVRLLIGDTDPARPLLSDAELQALIDQFGPSEVRVAIEAAQAIAAAHARRADQTVGRVSLRASQIAEQYRRIAQDLRRRLAMTAPYAGGTSKADMARERTEDDRPREIFWVGMHDYPGGVGRRRG